MAITFISSSVAHDWTGTATKLVWSHTVTDVQNRLLLIEVTPGIDYVTWGPVGSVTYGAQSASLIERSQEVGRRAEIWGITGSAVGTANVTITAAGPFGDGITAGALSFSGVDQTTPWGTATHSWAPPTDLRNKAYMNVQTTVGGIAVDTMGKYFVSASTEQPGQVQLWTYPIVQPDAGGLAGHGSMKVATSTTTAMSWSFTDPTQWAIVAVGINAAADAPVATVRYPTIDNINSMQGIRQVLFTQ